MMFSANVNPAPLLRFAKPERYQGRIGLGLALLIFGCGVTLHIYSVAFFKINATTAPIVPVLFALLCWLSVGMFIVAHDAMHGSLVPGSPRLSSFVGGLMLCVYAGFGWRKMRDAHMDHHKYSGTARDPDFDAVHPTAFWPWYFTFLKRYFGVVPIIYVFAVTWSYILLFHFDPVNVVILYGAPAIISSLQLFYFGTYRPHRHEAGSDFPDHHNARTSHYSVLTSLITCFHFGYHEEHHIAPYVPWWGLPARHRARRDAIGHSPEALSYDMR
jgi:beta-carotene/zeaxanthin 4-ketolase